MREAKRQVRAGAREAAPTRAAAPEGSPGLASRWPTSTARLPIGVEPFAGAADPAGASTSLAARHPRHARC